jgi:hypothetical protein
MGHPGGIGIVLDVADRVVENLLGRIGGPLTLRLILQPLVATILATRAGLRDAREGRVPYGWALFSNPAARSELLREGWKDVAKVFVLAVALDVAYQVIVHRWVHPGETLLVASAVALVPYVVVRCVVTRAAQARAARKQRNP